MSGVATGDCWEHSPFRATREVTQLLVHLAIADVVNDLHGNRLWMTRESLATKSMASKATVARTLATLTELGWLTVITPGGGRGNATEYQYALGGKGLTVSPFSEETVSPGGPNGLTSEIASSTQQKEPNAQLPLDDPHAFDLWWKGYPRPIGKAKAREKFDARRREGATLAALTQARDAYAESVAGKEPTYIKHAATFLAKDGPWTEWLNGDPEAQEDPGTITQQLARAQWAGPSKGADTNGDHERARAASR